MTGTQAPGAPTAGAAPTGGQETAGTARSWVGDPAPAVSPSTSVPDGRCGSPAVASAAPATSARPALQGEGGTGRVSTSLQQFARALGLPGTGRTWSYDDLLNRCADAYWQNRPDFGPRCGSLQGYRAHQRKRQPTCPPCRAAYATCVAVRRLRKARGVPNPVRPLQPCGTHAAFVRHKSRSEQPCPACELAERQYQHDHYQRQRTSAAA